MQARSFARPPAQARWASPPDRSSNLSRNVIPPHSARFICRSASSNDDAILRQQAKALDQLFYSASSSEESGIDVADDPARASLLSLPGVIPDLPLWRVQWAVLPSYQEVLHVHVPHYVDLFSRLFTQNKRPWRFGHLMLPGGSASLGDQKYALQYGSNAPLVGTLMEVVQAVRFPDGRLLILAAGVGRFKVLNTLQTVPASRADVMLLPDEEELLSASYTSTKALESLTKGTDEDFLSVTRAMHAVDAAAQHAASASAQTFWEYELMHCRVHEKLAVIDSSDNETAAMQFGRRLVNIGSNEIMELPWAAGDLNIKYFSSMQTSSNYNDMMNSDDEEESESPLFDINVKADAAVFEAAEEMIQRLLQQEKENEDRKKENSLLWRELETFLRNRYSAINSLKERGVNPIASSGAGGRRAPTSTATSLDDTEDEGEMNDEERKEKSAKTSKSDSFLVECLRLEQQVWQEVDAVRDLAEKIAGRATPLADGLMCLRPPTDISSPTGLEYYKQQQEDGGGGGGGGGGVEGKMQNDKEEESNFKLGGKEAFTLSDGNIDSTNGKEGAHPGYPALRRVQRLSFALASSLGDVSASEGRQAWLEVHSIAGRLRLGLSALRRHRDVLAAVVAVRNLTDTGRSGGGGDGEKGGDDDELEDRLM